MIKAKKSISPNNTVFFSEKNEDDFETIIEDCYSSSGDNLLSGVSTSYRRPVSATKRPKFLTIKGMTSNLKEMLSTKVEELIVCQSQQVVKSKDIIELTDISDFELDV